MLTEVGACLEGDIFDCFLAGGRFIWQGKQFRVVENNGSSSQINSYLHYWYLRLRSQGR